jgi:hypothetical protein
MVFDRFFAAILIFPESLSIASDRRLLLSFLLPFNLLKILFPIQSVRFAAVPISCCPRRAPRPGTTVSWHYGLDHPGWSRPFSFY